jgi:hypothetical protein
MPEAIEGQEKVERGKAQEEKGSDGGRSM